MCCEHWRAKKANDGTNFQHKPEYKRHRGCNSLLKPKVSEKGVVGVLILGFIGPKRLRLWKKLYRVEYEGTN